jgi:hypothetical protein
LIYTENRFKTHLYLKKTQQKEQVDVIIREKEKRKQIGASTGNIGSE